MVLNLAGSGLSKQFLPDRNDPLLVSRMNGVQPTMPLVFLGRLRGEFIPAPAFEN